MNYLTTSVSGKTENICHTGWGNDMTLVSNVLESRHKKQTIINGKSLQSIHPRLFRRHWTRTCLKETVHKNNIV